MNRADDLRSDVAGHELVEATRRGSRSMVSTLQTSATLLLQTRRLLDSLRNNPATSDSFPAPRHDLDQVRGDLLQQAVALPEARPAQIPDDTAQRVVNDARNELRAARSQELATVGDSGGVDMDVSSDLVSINAAESALNRIAARTQPVTARIRATLGRSGNRGHATPSVATARRAQTNVRGLHAYTAGDNKLVIDRGLDEQAREQAQRATAARTTTLGPG